jgi:hypothetical protein
MKSEIKDPSGKILFTAEAAGNRLNINNAQSEKLCCLEHDGKKLRLKDAQEKVITEVPETTGE